MWATHDGPCLLECEWEQLMCKLSDVAGCRLQMASGHYGKSPTMLPFTLLLTTDYSCG